MDWKEAAIEKLAKRRERTGGYFTNAVVEGDPEAIYSPGVVAHEAGHAKLHQTPVLGTALDYAPILVPMIAGGIAYSRAGGDQANQQQAARQAVEKITPYLTGARLADEAGSSLIGLSNLKQDVKAGKMSKEDYAAARRGLASAFGTYGIAAAAPHVKDEGTQKALEVAGLGAKAGALFSERGGMTAEQAARKVHDIAPGTDVYSINVPISGGSLYLPKARTPIGGLAHRAMFAAVLPQKEITRLSERGGVITAPVHAGTAGVGIAQEIVNKVSPLGGFTPMLTYPGQIRKGKRVVVEDLEGQKGDVMTLERAKEVGGIRGLGYKLRHPLETVGIVGPSGSSPPKKGAPPKKEEAPKEKAASMRMRMEEGSASPHVQYLRKMLTQAQAT